MKMTLLRSAAAALLSTIACAPLQAATIRLVADEWCPYNCAPEADRPGYMIEIARRVFAEAGHTVEYRNLPWTRSIAEARRGNYEGIVGTTPEDAPDFVFPAQAMGMSASAFWVRAGSDWRYEGLESLDRVSLGVIGGYAYFDALNAYIEQHKRTTARIRPAYGEDAFEKQMSALAQGRIDAFVEDRHVVNYYLYEKGAAGRFKEAGEEVAVPIHIAFSPSLPQAREYADLLGAGVARLRASGELAKILARYGLQDWQR